MSKTLRIIVPEDLHKNLKITACQRNKTMNQAVIESISNWLKVNQVRED